MTAAPNLWKINDASELVQRMLVTHHSNSEHITHISNEIRLDCIKHSLYQTLCIILPSFGISEMLRTLSSTIPRNESSLMLLIGFLFRDNVWIA